LQRKHQLPDFIIHRRHFNFKEKPSKAKRGTAMATILQRNVISNLRRFNNPRMFSTASSKFTDIPVS